MEDIFWELKRRSQRNRKRRLKKDKAAKQQLPNCLDCGLMAGTMAFNPIQHAKEIADLIQKYNDTDLYRKIIHLEGEILELSRANHKLERENSDLQTKLEFQGKMTFKKPFYLQEGDSQPFCAQCWESSRNVIHVLGPTRDDINEVFAWDCPKCKTDFFTSGNGYGGNFG
jgi:hypothetical protein